MITIIVNPNKKETDMKVKLTEEEKSEIMTRIFKLSRDFGQPGGTTECKKCGKWIKDTGSKITMCKKHQTHEQKM